jgi:hypothetical protein
VGPYHDNSITVYEDRLFVGTVKVTDPPAGGELWLLLPSTTYLPMLLGQGK